MEQNTIYDYLGNNNDPVYHKLLQLDKGDSVVLEDAEVSFNVFGLYEVSTVDIHEGFSDLGRCYEFICEFLGEKMLSD